MAVERPTESREQKVARIKDFVASYDGAALVEAWENSIQGRPQKPDDSRKIIRSDNHQDDPQSIKLLENERIQELREKIEQMKPAVAGLDLPQTPENATDLTREYKDQPKSLLEPTEIEKEGALDQYPLYNESGHFEEIRVGQEWEMTDGGKTVVKRISKIELIKSKDSHKDIEKYMDQKAAAATTEVGQDIDNSSASKNLERIVGSKPENKLAITFNGDERVITTVSAWQEAFTKSKKIKEGKIKKRKEEVTTLDEEGQENTSLEVIEGEPDFIKLGDETLTRVEIIDPLAPEGTPQNAVEREEYARFHYTGDDRRLYYVDRAGKLLLIKPEEKGTHDNWYEYQMQDGSEATGSSSNRTFSDILNRAQAFYSNVGEPEPRFDNQVNADAKITRIPSVDADSGEESAQVAEEKTEVEKQKELEDAKLERVGWQPMGSPENQATFIDNELNKGKPVLLYRVATLPGEDFGKDSVGTEYSQWQIVNGELTESKLGSENLEPSADQNGFKVSINEGKVPGNAGQGMINCGEFLSQEGYPYFAVKENDPKIEKPSQVELSQKGRIDQYLQDHGWEPMGSPAGNDKFLENEMAKSKSVIMYEVAEGQTGVDVDLWKIDGYQLIATPISVNDFTPIPGRAPEVYNLNMDSQVIDQDNNAVDIGKFLADRSYSNYAVKVNNTEVEGLQESKIKPTVDLETQSLEKMTRRAESETASFNVEIEDLPKVEMFKVRAFQRFCQEIAPKATEKFADLKPGEERDFLGWPMEVPNHFLKVKLVENGGLTFKYYSPNIGADRVAVAAIEKEDFWPRYNLNDPELTPNSTIAYGAVPPQTPGGEPIDLEKLARQERGETREDKFIRNIEAQLVEKRWDLAGETSTKADDINEHLKLGEPVILYGPNSEPIQIRQDGNVITQQNFNWLRMEPIGEVTTWPENWNIENYVASADHASLKYATNRTLARVAPNPDASGRVLE